jgi:enamine deaminase RidA (YjgF/YER057c/UK114 family)
MRLPTIGNADIEAVLKFCGAGWDNAVEFTTYLVHAQDIAKFMDYRKREFPKLFPNGGIRQTPC